MPFASLTGESSVSAPLIKFFESLNDISPATFNRIAGLTSNAQAQLNALGSKVAAMENNIDDVWEGSVQQMLLTPENQLGPTEFLANIRQTALSTSNVLGDTDIGNLTMGGKSIVQSGDSLNQLGSTSITSLTVTDSILLPSNVQLAGATNSGDVTFTGAARILQSGSGSNALKSTAVTGNLTLAGNFTQSTGSTSLKTTTVTNLTVAGAVTGDLNVTGALRLKGNTVQILPGIYKGAPNPAYCTLEMPGANTFYVQDRLQTESMLVEGGLQVIGATALAQATATGLQLTGALGQTASASSSLGNVTCNTLSVPFGNTDLQALTASSAVITGAISSLTTTSLQEQIDSLGTSTSTNNSSLAARASYKRNKSADSRAGDRFVLDHTLSNGEHKVFMDNENGGAPVISFAGTRKGGDLITDAALLLGLERFTPRFKREERFVKKVK
ncbi:hypothetical protein B484DRAFT_437068, partial [Ochromonadaceae sp. CCMP2298]